MLTWKQFFALQGINLGISFAQFKLATSHLSDADKQKVQNWINETPDIILILKS